MDLIAVVEDVAEVVVEEYVVGTILTIVSLIVSVTKTLWMIWVRSVSQSMTVETILDRNCSMNVFWTMMRV
jgi:hypothetical protein